MEFETPRLRLDALHLSDAAALLGYRADPAVARYQGWCPASLAEAEQFIREQRAMPAFLTGQWFQRAIRLRGDGALIGDLGVCLSDDGQATFGITVSPFMQGQGVAREVVHALLDRLFGDMDVHRVHASVDPRNAASMALLRSLGLRQEAHFRESYLLRGEWVDDVIFAMLAREWRDRAPEAAGSAASR